VIRSQAACRKFNPAHAVSRRAGRVLAQSAQHSWALPAGAPAQVPSRSPRQRANPWQVGGLQASLSVLVFTADAPRQPSW